MLILFNVIASSQDTIIKMSSFKTVPNCTFSRDDVLFKIIKEKEFDYWEYRYVYETQVKDCPMDSIDCVPPVLFKYEVLEKGNYKQVNDSIEIGKINCKKGFWWIPPSGGELYVVTIKSNQPDSIVNKDDLLHLILPFNSLDKIKLYYDNYKPVRYLRNKDNFELIVYDQDKPIRYYENKRGKFNVFEKLYLRIYEDGRLYKKSIGEYHLKVTEPNIII